MIKQKKRWVLVADGARARVFVRAHGTLKNALGHDFIGDNAKPSAIGTSKPGRDFESAYPGRHSYEPRTDWRQHQKEVFAEELCEVLEKSNNNKELDELVVVASPKTLGNLRAHFSKQLLDKITAEIPKDVTKFTESELIEFLEREL